MKLSGLLPVAIAAVALGLLAACDDPPPTPKGSAASAVASWPPPAPPDQPVVANLLADNWEFVIDASGNMTANAHFTVATGGTTTLAEIGGRFFNSRRLLDVTGAPLARGAVPAVLMDRPRIGVEKDRAPYACPIRHDPADFVRGRSRGRPRVYAPGCLGFGLGS